MATIDMKKQWKAADFTRFHKISIIICLSWHDIFYTLTENKGIRLSPEDLRGVLWITFYNYDRPIFSLVPPAHIVPPSCHFVIALCLRLCSSFISTTPTVAVRHKQDLGYWHAECWQEEQPHLNIRPSFNPTCVLSTSEWASHSFNPTCKLPVLSTSEWASQSNRCSSKMWRKAPSSAGLCIKILFALCDRNLF